MGETDKTKLRRNFVEECSDIVLTVDCGTEVPGVVPVDCALLRPEADIAFTRRVQRRRDTGCIGGV